MIDQLEKERLMHRIDLTIRQMLELNQVPTGIVFVNVETGKAGVIFPDDDDRSIGRGILLEVADGIRSGRSREIK